MLGYASEELDSEEIIPQITDSVKASLDLTLMSEPFTALVTVSDSPTAETL